MIRMCLIVQVIFFLTLIGCDLTRHEPLQKAESSIAEEQSRNIIIYEYSDNFLHREIRATSMKRFYQSNKVFADSIKIIEYDREEKKNIKFSLTADNAEIDDFEKKYIFTNNVVVTNPQMTLFTSKLILEDLKDEINAPEEVTIIRGDNVMKGYGLVSSIHFDNIRMSRVTAEGKITDEEIDW